MERKDGKRGVECGLCHANVEVIWDWNQLRESVLKQRQLQKETEENKQNGIEGNGTSEEEQTSTTNGDIYFTNPSNETESTDLLLRHYRPLLSSGHTPKCPWTSRTTETTVLRLPPALLSLPSLISRLATLTPILPFLPNPSQITTPKPLPSTFPTSLTTYDSRLLQCGLIGWSGSLLGAKGILICSTCHRRVGLWLFSQDSRSLDGDEEEGNLDLVTEHKQYCPWINVGVQTGMPGWEYLFELVQPRGSGGVKRRRDGDGDGDGDQGKESRFKKLREMLKGVRRK